MSTVPVERGRDISLNGSSGSETQAVHQRLKRYLAALGLTDPEITESLVEESLKRAERRTARGDVDELMRRSLEEVQRRIDAAIAKAYGLSVAKDPHRIAAIRAVMLIRRGPGSGLAEVLRVPEGESVERGAPTLPFATPEEARLTIHPQPISFFFGPSSASSE